MSAEAPVFVDTNVLVYAFDRSESRRRRIAAELLDELAGSNRLRLSTQVLQEFFVTVTRKIAHPLPAGQVLELLDDLAAWPLFLVDYQAIRQAAGLAAELPLAFWDALVLVAARRSGAEIVYSEDMSHQQLIHGVRIIDPFRRQPEQER